MPKLSSSFILGIVVKILVLLAIAKGISLAFVWFLPADGVDVEVRDSYKPKYQRVDFKIMLENAKVTKPKQQLNSSGVSITNMILKGLYGKGSTGFAIVALKSSSQKTSIISVGESFSGYTLKSILKNSVVFVKMGKEYILRMKDVKLSGSITRVTQDNFSEDKSVKNVARNDINFYRDNPKQLWRDVSISPLKDGNELKGFKVMKIRDGSKLSRLGLRVGDIIIRANNTELKSYNDVFKIYNNISKLEAVNIVILRDNQERELVYEIN